MSHTRHQHSTMLLHDKKKLIYSIFSLNILKDQLEKFRIRAGNSGTFNTCRGLIIGGASQLNCRRRSRGFEISNESKLTPFALLNPSRECLIVAMTQQRLFGP